MSVKEDTEKKYKIPPEYRRQKGESPEQAKARTLGYFENVALPDLYLQLSVEGEQEAKDLLSDNLIVKWIRKHFYGSTYGRIGYWLRSSVTAKEQAQKDEDDEAKLLTKLQAIQDRKAKRTTSAIVSDDTVSETPTEEEAEAISEHEAEGSEQAEFGKEIAEETT